MKVLHLLSILTVFVTAASAAKILLVFPMPSRSHTNLGEGFARHLLSAGHHVTMMVAFPSLQHPNLTIADISYLLKLHEEKKHNNELNIESLANGTQKMNNPVALFNMMLRMSNSLLDSNVTSDLFVQENFDLVVMEWFFNDVLISLGPLMKCPLLLFVSTDMHNMVLDTVEHWSSPATAVDILSADFPPYTFWQRVKSLGFSIMLKGYMELVYRRSEAELYKKYILPLAERKGITMPSYSEVTRQTSMVLYNNYPSTGVAFSLPPNVKGIGGYHIKTPTDKLPVDLQKIMDNSKDGVIYFSMGSLLKSEELLPERKRKILEIFGKLKQTVLWKFSEQLENMPPNVHIMKWLPQPSILAHPNTKIFITHGGLLSMTEAIHFGVPLLGMPVFGDQFLNVMKGQKQGFAKTVMLGSNEFDKDFENAINEMLTNPSYTNTIKHLSALFHDRPLAPGDELNYWVDHVIRTNGAPHLRSVTRDVPLYQILYLDLIGMIVVGIYILKLVICRILCKKSSPVDKNKKQKKN